MNRLLYLLVGAFLLTVFNSCKKDTITSNNNFTWTRIHNTPLSGGSIGEFIFFYDDGSKLYTAQAEDNTGGAGTFSSVDSGKTWTPITVACDVVMKSGNNLILNAVVGNAVAYIYSGGAITPINSLCSPPLNSIGSCRYIKCLGNINDSTVLAGTQEGLIKSSDNGSAWTVSNTGISLYSSGGVTHTMGISKLTSVGQYIFAATDYLNSSYTNIIFKSSDNGATWTQSNNGLGLIAQASEIKKMFTLGNAVYIVYRSGGDDLIFKTEDYGATWTQVNFTLPSNQKLRSLTAYNTTIFALTSQAVYKSNDNGASWVKISPDEIFYNQFGDLDDFNSITATGGKLFIAGSSAMYNTGIAYYTLIQ